MRFRKTSAAGAVLVVRFLRRAKTCYLAFTFGFGSYALRDSVIERNFGFRSALNIILAGDTGDGVLERIRAVQTKRVDRNTVRAQRQAARKATLEVFDLDLERDLLNGIAGEPQDIERWGPRITGSDSLQLSVERSFDELGEVGRSIVSAHEKKDYKRRFGFVDDLSVVRDAETVAKLEQEVIAGLQAKDYVRLDVNLPTMVDLNRVVSFRFPGDARSRVTRPNLELPSLVSSFHGRGKLDALGPR